MSQSNWCFRVCLHWIKHWACQDSTTVANWRNNLSLPESTWKSYYNLSTNLSKLRKSWNLPQDSRLIYCLEATKFAYSGTVDWMSKTSEALRKMKNRNKFPKVFNFFKSTFFMVLFNYSIPSFCYPHVLVMLWAFTT